MNRVDALKRKAFEKKAVDGFLIFNPNHLLYFTRCSGLASLLISQTDKHIVYVYSVNYEQAKIEAKGFSLELVKRGEDLMEKIAVQVKALRIKTLAVDTLNVESYRSLAKKLKGNARLVIQGGLVWELRRVKDRREIGFVRKAGELVSEGMKVAYEMLRPSMKEYEVAAEIEYTMRRKGSWGTAFDTIVASGARSAFPHGGCLDRELRNGDLVVIDVGAVYQCYRSDMTRTFVIGKPSRKQEKLYEIVKIAQEKAFYAMKPKTKGREIDAVARKVITDAGYGDNFVHGLGHGVGLEVHEPPTLSPESKDKLVAGNVITNEPGIYIVGFGGIRIEDTVLIQRHKAEKLTSGMYSL